MSEYLLFRLYGAMAAWGGIAVGEERPSETHPGRSAILGLLAAALGIGRDEEERQADLNRGYLVAVRVDAAGVLLRDYHTAQAPGVAEMKKRPNRTRRDQLLAPELNTVLTYRSYYTDALYTVAITAQADAPHKLGALAKALDRPRWPLYLGRKSCPLALPLSPQVVEAASLADAMVLLPNLEQILLVNLHRHGEMRDWWNLEEEPSLYWDSGMEEKGLEGLMSVVRRDQPLHRCRWQFADRSEHRGRLARAVRDGG
ncbi:MAG: type I-E CRISPR-associated protein Cas5/CasD [Magnetococcales bacterium]|nr:type I-E CRISPR-associated protein Cas5/CasD [Magnetococcales bacterium]